jgi:hypothetical protein
MSCRSSEGLEDLTKALESQVKSLYARTRPFSSLSSLLLLAHSLVNGSTTMMINPALRAARRPRAS